MKSSNKKKSPRLGKPKRTLKERSLFDRMINNSSEAIMLFDNEANITRINKAFTQLFGYTIDEIKGKKSSDTIGRQFSDEIARLTKNVQQGGINNIDAIRHHKDGTPINVTIFSMPIVDGNKYTCIFSVFRDNTVYKNAEINLHRERNLLRAILESIPDEVYVKDRQGRFLLANSACSRALSTVGISTPEELIGKTDLDLLSPDIARSMFDEEQQMMAENKPILGKEQTQRDKSTGEIFRSVLISKIPLRDPHGNVVGLVGVNREVTGMAKVREALKVSEGKYRTIFENVQDVFYQTDLSGTITEISPSIERYSHYTREELIGKPVETVYHQPNDRKKLMKILLDKGEVVDIQLPLRTKDNKVIHTSINAHLQYDSTGKPTGVEGSLRNLSERIKAENSLRETTSRLSMLIQNLNSGILMVNEEGNVLLVNEQFRSIFKIEQPLADIPSGHPDEIRHSVEQFFSDKETFNSRIKEILLWREPVVREEWILNDGWIGERDYVPIVVEGEYKGHLWQYHDVTENRRAQEILARYAEDLYRAKQQADQQNFVLEEQSHELIDAREVALQASKLKSEFVANMSHEIRTPMNGVLSIAELLMETNLTAEQKEYVGIIMNSGESLLKIINDVLDFSKIEAGKLSIEINDFNLETVVEETATLLSYRANEKRIELIPHIYNTVPILLRGDPARIRQVITNFVSNAIKFTDQGEVIVRVTVERQHGNKVELKFSISDTGIGIPIDVQQKLFQPFIQADGSTTRKYGGTGLGLTISKQLVEMMGGKIGLESTPGSGSTFWFTLPLELQERSEPAVPVNLPALNVLVIDDNKTNRLILMQHFASWGMKADEANDGDSAMTFVEHSLQRTSPYQLIVVDMQMPAMNGLDVVKKIKTVMSQPPKIIMISSMKVPVEEWSPAGIDVFLLKPVRKSELSTIISSLFSSDKKQSTMTPLTHHTVKQKNMRSLSVLVVEDNPVNQKVAVKMLEQLKIAPDLATNGIEAVEAVTKKPYDIVFMDVQMPLMDGLEATKKIREHEYGKLHTTIVAMTANALQGDRERCLQAGMDDYLSKPIKQKDLLTMIERWTSVKSIDDGVTQPKQESGTGEMIDDARIKEIQDLGDESLVKELMGIYLNDSTQSLNDIESALASNDVNLLRESSHKLKGSSANLGIKQVHRISAEIENLARANDLFTAKKLSASLFDQFEKVKQHIQLTYLSS